MLDPFAPFRLDGRTAVVTGASSGLGERFARVLAAAGATVVVSARRAERLEALARDVPGLTTVPGDVADPDHRSELVDAALARTGRLDVLVNNAGTTDEGPALEEAVEEFERVLDVNLTAVFALSQLVARHMVTAGRGSIATSRRSSGSSASGSSPRPGTRRARAPS